MKKKWLGVTDNKTSVYVMVDSIKKEVRDNLDPVDDFFFGISNVKDYHNSTYTPLGHMIYTHFEWCNGAFYKSLCYHLNQLGIKTMLDVGGCNGHVSKILIDNVKTLESSIIIEPIPQNYYFIKFRFCNESRIQICNKAIYYGKNSLSLISEDDNLGGFHIANLNAKKDKLNEVKTTTLEQFPICDFIKMDIEGSEYNVIKNSPNIKKIPFINIEFHDFIEDDGTKHTFNNWQNFIEDNFPDHKIGLDGNNFTRGTGRPYDEQVFLIPKNYNLSA